MNKGHLKPYKKISLIDNALFSILNLLVSVVKNLPLLWCKFWMKLKLKNNLLKLIATNFI